MEDGRPVASLVCGAWEASALLAPGGEFALVLFRLAEHVRSSGRL